MVQYADFHSTIATLAPVILLAGLVGLHRLGSDQPLFPRVATLVFVGGGCLFALGEVIVSLSVLGGLARSTEAMRLYQGAILVGLLCAVLLAALYEILSASND